MLTINLQMSQRPVHCVYKRRRYSTNVAHQRELLAISDHISNTAVGGLWELTTHRCSQCTLSHLHQPIEGFTSSLDYNVCFNGVNRLLLGVDINNFKNVNFVERKTDVTYSNGLKIGCWNIQGLNVDKLNP